MKYFLIIWITLSAQTLKSDEMIGLKDYMNSHSPEDPAVMSYVASRCSAVFSVSASFSKEGSEMYKRFENNASSFILLSFQIQKKINPNAESNETESRVMKTIEGIGSTYIKQANKNFLDNGTYFNELMLDDIELCNMLDI